MTVPADAPAGTVSCGPLRRESDGCWYYGRTLLGRDGAPSWLLTEGERAGMTAAVLAEALRGACDELARMGSTGLASQGRVLLRRFGQLQQSRR